uniref:Uncharacterized protein n=1 Tax=Peronospora matthiolae TaxID=2874970 RepID=A0AAV1U9L1_9STRA
MQRHLLPMPPLPSSSVSILESRCRFIPIRCYEYRGLLVKYFDVAEENAQRSGMGSSVVLGVVM